MTKLKLSELKSIHDWVRDTSSAQIFFVALLVFPFVAASYLGTIKLAGLERNNSGIMIGLLVLYVISISIMKICQTTDEKYKVDLAILKYHAKSNDIQYISFGTLLEKDKKYTESYIRKLISKYPSEVIIANFNNNKSRGLKILKFQELRLSDL